MTHTIEIEESDVRIIVAFCDIALKNGGMQYYGAVQRILSLMPQPEQKEEEKDG
jgi:hypothetical protein